MRRVPRGDASGGLKDRLEGGNEFQAVLRRIVEAGRDADAAALGDAGAMHGEDAMIVEQGFDEREIILKAGAALDADRGDAGMHARIIRRQDFKASIAAHLGDP